MGWQPKGYSFDAKQARDLSENLDVKATVEEILIEVKGAAYKGYKTVTTFNKNIVGYEPRHRRIAEELRSLGFEVDMQYDQRDGDSVEVSWK